MNRTGFKRYSIGSLFILMTSLLVCVTSNTCSFSTTLSMSIDDDDSSTHVTNLQHHTGVVKASACDELCCNLGQDVCNIASYIRNGDTYTCQTAICTNNETINCIKKAQNGYVSSMTLTGGEEGTSANKVYQDENSTDTSPTPATNIQTSTHQMTTQPTIETTTDSETTPTDETTSASTVVQFTTEASPQRNDDFPSSVAGVTFYPSEPPVETETEVVRKDEEDDISTQTVTETPEQVQSNEVSEQVPVAGAPAADVPAVGTTQSPQVVDESVIPGSPEEWETTTPYNYYAGMDDLTPEEQQFLDYIQQNAAIIEEEDIEAEKEWEEEQAIIDGQYPYNNTSDEGYYDEYYVYPPGVGEEYDEYWDEDDEWPATPTGNEEPDGSELVYPELSGSAPILNFNDAIIVGVIISIVVLFVALALLLRKFRSVNARANYRKLEDEGGVREKEPLYSDDGTSYVD